jgi:hypothetical protein
METIKTDKQSSVEVSKTSTNKYSWSIKIYFDEQNTEYKEVLDRINTIDTELRLKYGDKE